MNTASMRRLRDRAPAYTPAPAGDDLKLVVGARAIAEQLGVTVRQVHHWIEIEALPGVFKIGRSLAIREADLRALSNRGVA